MEHYDNEQAFLGDSPQRLGLPDPTSLAAVRDHVENLRVQELAVAISQALLDYGTRTVAAQIVVGIRRRDLVSAEYGERAYVGE